MEDKETESLVEYRLTQIEKKLDQVTELLTKEPARELRLVAVEKGIKEIQEAKKNNIDKWLNPLVAALVSGVVSSILFALGVQ